MNNWFAIVVVVGFVIAIVEIAGLKGAIDKLQRQVEHLHNVMLDQFDKH